MSNYSMSTYWEERLRKHFDLTGVGCVVLGPGYNARLYKARLEALENGLRVVGWTFRGARILEAGCGTGFYTEYCLRQEVNAYVGVDITSVSVEILRRRYPDFHFVQADITSSEVLKAGTEFDIVLAADVLFHIVDDANFERAVRNLLFLLRPNGLLILSDVFPTTTIQTASHVRLRSLSEYNRLFSENQTRILYIEPIFAILQPPSFIPSLSWFWKGYALFWRYAWRLARWSVADHLLPPVLAWLDKTWFLPKWGSWAPNNKWLFALKENVA
jgi:2-polyprenyl-3-methyl-5-hydroxy-6-metoxy-1,4-benzoquinol methylase